VLAPLALTTLALAAAATDGGETVVRARAADDVDNVRVDGGAVWDGGAALLLVPGATLARDGGPLSPVRPVVRGLSGPRLAVTALGLSLDDPAAGVVDVGLLPWGMGDVVVDVGAGAGLGGALSLRRPAPGVQIVVGAGSVGTLRARGRVAEDVEGGHVAGFVDVGSTRGDFPFVNDDTLGTGGPDAVRANNDQQRANVAAAADVDAAGVRVAVAASGAARRGGVPGFASAPLALRAEDALGAVGAQARARAGVVVVDVGVAAAGSDRRVFGVGAAGPTDSRLVGARAGASARATASIVEGATASLRARADRSAIVAVVDRDAARLDADATVRAAVGPLVVGVDARVGVGVVVDRDLRAAVERTVDGTAAREGATLTLLPQGALRVLAADGDGAATAFLGVTRASRAPTLDERYAPRGFVRGNPALRPEAVDELEAGVVVGTDAARARVVGHVSALRDGIVVVHKNAFELGPENTGAATRAGVDVGVALRPTPLVSVDVAASLLVTALASTGAPLPGAPPVALALAPRVGDDDGWLRALLAVRGPVSSTLFGTLTSPGTVLLDVEGRLPLAPRLGVLVSLHNALDVRDARDQNLLPLPGRLVFVSLEVRA